MAGWVRRARRLSCPFCSVTRQTRARILALLFIWAIHATFTGAISLADRESAFVGWSEKDVGGVLRPPDCDKLQNGMSTFSTAGVYRFI